MTTTGAIVGDTTVGELELYSLDVKFFKSNEVVDVEDQVLKTENAEEENAEPVTTRWELWSWYAYYFGNNSAGTLSYAPLSRDLHLSLPIPC
jgi:hypothetical protein